MSISGKRGWLRVWMVASAAWVVVTVGLQVPAYLERQRAFERGPSIEQIMRSNNPYGSVELRSKSEVAWDNFWRNARVPLIVAGPPLAVPALVLLVLWVSRWVGAGFESDRRE